MVRLASPSASLNLIAREIFLDSVLGLYTVGVATHIPGISNVLPDHLSRLWAPDAHAFPTELVDVPELQVPNLDGRFWKTAPERHRAGQKARKRKAVGGRP